MQALPFEIELFSKSSCVKNWRFPRHSFDSSYAIGSEELIIEFDGVDITNCPFTLTVLNITDSEVKPLDPRLASVEEPLQIADNSDANLVTVSAYGRLIVETNEKWAIGEHKLRLVVTTRPSSNDLEAEESRSLDFSLAIAPCINLATSSERRYDTFEYVVDEVSPHVLHLPLVERLVPSCASSHFELVPDQSELPTAFRVSN